MSSIKDISAKGMRCLGGNREQGAERSQRYPPSGYQRKSARGCKADRLHAKLQRGPLKRTVPIIWVSFFVDEAQKRS